MTKGWALVTGAAKRIGRTIALDLAAHGWDIVVHYHTSADAAQKLAQEINALGRAVVLAEINLANAQAASNLIPSLAEEIGMIDALINNASLFEPDSTDPEGTRHWAVNADAPRLLSKAFRDHLPPTEKAAIVNLLDATPPADNFSAYEKARQFRFGLTTNMAKSYAPQVRVNGVACGYVLPSPRQSEEDFRKMSGGKIVTPQQVATSVRQLLETPGLTGQITIIA